MSLDQGSSLGSLSKSWVRDLGRDGRMRVRVGIEGEWKWGIHVYGGAMEE